MVIVFLFFLHECTDLLFCSMLKSIQFEKSTVHTPTVTAPSAQEAPAFRWQEAALAMETAVWAGVLQVKHKHTHTPAIWCQLWKRQWFRNRNRLMHKTLFLQTITSSHCRAHKHTFTQPWVQQSYFNRWRTKPLSAHVEVMTRSLSSPVSTSFDLSSGISHLLSIHFKSMLQQHVEQDVFENVATVSMLCCVGRSSAK